MNRTIKDATVKCYFYQTHEQLKAHFQTFLIARRLKTPKGLTPCEFACKDWTKKPERFRINQIQHTVGTKHRAFTTTVCREEVGL